MADYNLGTARGRVEIDAKGVGRGLNEANTELNKFQQNADRTNQNMRKAGTVMVGAAVGIAAGFGVAIKAAADFDSRMSAIAAVSGASGAELDKLREKALKLGADTKFSASESASAMEELVKAGLSIEDVLNGAADATVNLAAAGEVDLVTAATLASNAMNAFGLSAEEMPKVADLIAGAANASAIDVGEFGQSLQQVGAVANLAGLSFDDTALAIAAMGNAGIRGSDAGTSLKTMLQNLIPVTDKQIGLFEELGIVTEDGANRFFDAQGNVKSMAEISEVLGGALKGMSKEQKLATLETMFGSDAIRAASVIADTGAEGFNELAGAMGEVTAQEVAEKRMDNLGGSIEQLVGSVETLLIIIGKPLADALRVWVDRLTGVINWISELDEGTLAMVATIGKVAIAVLGAGGAMLVFISYIGKIKAAFAALKIFMAANPFTVWMVAIAALVAGLVALYQNNETFRKAVQKLFGYIAGVAGPILDRIVEGFGRMIDVFQGDALSGDGGIVGFFEKVGAGARVVVDWITGSLIPAVQQLVIWIRDNVIPVVLAIGNWLLWLGEEVVERAIAGFFWLRDNVWPVMVALGELLFAIGERIAQFVMAVVTIAQTVAPLFIAVFGGMFSMVKSMVSAFVTVVTTLWNSFGDNLWRFIQTVFNLIKTIVESVLKGIQGFIQVVTGIISGDWGKVWDGIKNILAAVWNAMVGVVRAAWQVVANLLQAGLDVLQGIWNAVWGQIGGFLKTTWETMKTAVSTGIQAIINFFTEMPGKIIAALAALGQMLWQLYWDALGRAKQAVTDGVSNLINLVKTIPGKIISALGNVGRILYDAGKRLIGGFIDGIGSMFGAVGDKLGSLTSKLTSWKGPPEKDATILIENGQLVMQGFMEGILSQVPDIRRMLGEIAPVIQSDFGSLTSHITGTPTTTTTTTTDSSIHIDKVEIAAKDLEEIRTVQDFFDRIEQVSRQGVGAGV